jgi:TolB-like protein/tRNA A-37 threonylcarbamoyl transferase component Bud32/Flp pilus assembly protein TadD
MTAPTRVCPACHTPLPEAAQFCLQCGTPTPTDPGVPPRDPATTAVGVAKVRSALADRYRIERVLGEGGMATVYLAEDLKHRRRVAVKVMRPELAATLGASRFLREIEIATQLNHPHILPVYDSGEAGGVLYYVMPYVEGESLRERVQREGALPVDEALRLAREVAEALGYAHRRGIIHRDIKPANVLLGEGHALVADFGIARAAGGGQALTQTGLAVGTPQYMSPEQATGERDVDARADVYAIGAVLYEMLAGQAPYTGATPQAVLAKSLTEEVPPVASVRPGVPASVALVVGKAMARRPTDRYATGAELEQALAGARDAVRSGETAAAVAGGSARRAWTIFGASTVVSLAVIYGLVTRWGLPRWTLGLAALLLVIGAAVLFATGRAESRRRPGAAASGVGRWLTWSNAAWGGGLAAALFVVVALVLVFHGPSAASMASGGVRIAVLPFDNLGSASDAYFADGMSDAVRGKLTDLSRFRVTARTSSVQYRGTTKPPSQIGRELSVDYLLTGSVQWAHTGGGQGRVQVAPELIDAKTGDAKWQQTFTASVSDVFGVQAAIASRVAAALGVALGTADQRQIAARPTDNVAAYELYLKGEALSGNDPVTLRRASAFYEQAIALDSGFAEAWGRLASTLSLLYFNGGPDTAVAARAQAAAERALALSRGGAAGHMAMGVYRSLVLNDGPGAYQELSLALRAAPNDPAVLRRLGQQEFALGHEDSAIVHLEQVRRLDPRSDVAAQELANLYLYARRYPEASAASNEALALSPSDPGVIDLAVLVHLAQGDLSGARAVVRAAPDTLSRSALHAYLAMYYDLYWVLSDEQMQDLFRLPVSAFFNFPSGRWMALAEVAWYRGDRSRARAFADTAATAFRQTLRATPDDAQSHVLLGLALAYLGRKNEAIAEGERGVALDPISKDQLNGPYLAHQLARIYLLVGEPDKALDIIEGLLKVPYYLSRAWLRIDPEFAPLKGNPRFERLVAGG